MQEEEWRPIPDWDGYEVSSEGRVRSLDRVVQRSGQPMRIRGGMLNVRTRGVSSHSYLGVSLRSAEHGQKWIPVHQLVMFAFTGPRPAGCVIRHLDGNLNNNHRNNLAWGTQSENNLDAVRHGTHEGTAKLCCKYGHELREPNLVASRRAAYMRGCLACSRANAQVHRARRRGAHLDMQTQGDLYYAAIMIEQG